MQAVADHPLQTPVGHDSLPSEQELRQKVEAKTFRQVYGLTVIRRGINVTLRGSSPTFYVKQLATHAILDVVPHADVNNAIDVTRS